MQSPIDDDRTLELECQVGYLDLQNRRKEEEKGGRGGGIQVVRTSRRKRKRCAPEAERIIAEVKQQENVK